MDVAFSHYAVLHGSRNMVIFPCYLNPNSSLLACNSSRIVRVSPSHSGYQVLWQPFTDSAVDVSVISVGMHHFTLGESQNLTQRYEVFTRILSFPVFYSSGDTKYGVVVKVSEFGATVMLVYEDYPSPRIIQSSVPSINQSCLTDVFETQQNRKCFSWSFRVI
jgi:hypothetical protein